MSVLPKVAGRQYIQYSKYKSTVFSLRPQWVFSRYTQYSKYKSTVFSYFRVSDLSECLAALFPRKAYFHAALSQKQQTPTNLDFWNELKKKKELNCGST